MKIEGNRKYTVNEHKLDDINTPEKAYWYGMLLADGCNLRQTKEIILALKESDKEHLKAYNKFWESTYQIFTRKPNTQGSVVCSVSFWSEYLSKYLDTIGISPRKNFDHTTVWPDWLDDKLVSHFVRGFFDGNGSIAKSFSQIYITSSESFINSLSDYLFEKHDILSNIYDCGNNGSYTLAIARVDSREDFLEWMYRDSTPATRLSRKHDTCMDCLQYITERRIEKFKKEQEKKNRVKGKRGRPVGSKNTPETLKRLSKIKKQWWDDKKKDNQMAQEVA